MSEMKAGVEEIVASVWANDQRIALEYIRALANMGRIPSELLLSPKVGVGWSVNEQARWTRRRWATYDE